MGVKRASGEGCVCLIYIKKLSVLLFLTFLVYDRTLVLMSSYQRDKNSQKEKEKLKLTAPSLKKLNVT